MFQKYNSLLEKALVWLWQHAQTGNATHFYLSMDLSQVYESKQWVIDRFLTNVAQSGSLGTWPTVKYNAYLGLVTVVFTTLATFIDDHYSV